MLQYLSVYKHYNLQMWAAELIVIVTIYNLKTIANHFGLLTSQIGINRLFDVNEI